MPRCGGIVVLSIHLSIPTWKSGMEGGKGRQLPKLLQSNKIVVYPLWKRRARRRERVRGARAVCRERTIDQFPQVNCPHYEYIIRYT